MNFFLTLLPLATTTLNLMRPSHIHSKISTESLLNGAFDYNKTPIDPPGKKFIYQKTPSNRKTWAPHVVDCWYINRAPEHYFCHKLYIPNMRLKRLSVTVEFFPHLFFMLSTPSEDAATNSERNLTKAWLHPHSSTPFALINNDQLQALKKLSDILITSSTKTQKR